CDSDHLHRRYLRRMLESMAGAGATVAIWLNITSANLSDRCTIVRRSLFAKDEQALNLHTGT
ncbi:MAG: hypothetical protein ACOX44_11965, partial [Limnochordia bacterium]